MVYYEMMEKHTIRELVEAAGREYRDHAVLRYLVDGEITDLTFGEFARQSRSITAWVAEKSAEAGHPVRVAMMGPNSPLYVKLFMGVMCGGGVSMPMDPQMKEANICACLNKAEADIYIYDAAVTVDTDRIAREVPTLREVVKMETIEDIIQSYADRTDALEVSAADCAAIIFTSGTTGEEKGVMLSNGNFIDNIFSTIQVKGNVKLNILPLHHVFCITGDVLLCFANMATLCMNGNATKLVENLRLFQPNLVTMVPMVAQGLYNRLLQLAKTQGKEPAALKAQIFGPRIEKIVAGGAHLPGELVEKYQALGIFLCQGYGMSECSPSISSPDMNRKDKAHTAGKVVFRCKTRVVDGELQVKSPSVMMGYVNAPELTAQAITEDGWLRTGDIGYEDEEGFLHITGRLKNLIILSNGENVSPEQIEKLLLDHQIVKETLVYGEGNSIVAEIFPDSVYVKQYGITDIKAAIARVVEQVNAELPSHKKVMKHLIRVNPMQTTSSGKIVRSQRAGRDDVLPDDTQPLRLPEARVQQKLWDCIAGVLNRKDFGIDTDLFALGMDSLSCITTLTAFAEELDFHLELDAMLKHRTVLQLEQAYNNAAQTAKVDYTVRPVYPLINVQKYFAYLIRGNTTANVPVLLKLSPTVDLNRLADAAKKLFTVHPVLNNVVQMYENKGYANFRNDSRPVTIPVITLTPDAWEDQKKKLIRPYLYTENEPLYHIELYRVGQDSYLFFDVAHIIGDGVTLNLLITDLNKLYCGENVEPERYTFYEYLLDIHSRYESGAMDSQYRYFEELFAGARIDRTILNRKGQQDLSVHHQAALYGAFSRLDVKAVKDFCRKTGVTENNLFYTVFNYCVSIFRDQDEVVSTSINHGRMDSRWQQMAGCLFKTYNFRFCFRPDQTPSEMLQSAGQQLLQTLSHHLDNYHADEMFFQYQGDLLRFDQMGGAPAQVVHLNMDALPFHLNVLEGKENFVYDFRYWSNRFEESQLRLFLGVYEHTLRHIVDGGDVRDPQTYLPGAFFPAGDAKFVIRSRYGSLQPLGAWGTLYENGTATGRTARILPDGTVDYLEDSGRCVMVEGLTGRSFPNLQKLEDALNDYPGIRNARCCLTMTQKLFWSVTATFESDHPVDREKLNDYLKTRCEPSLMPAVMVEYSEK